MTKKMALQFSLDKYTHFELILSTLLGENDYLHSELRQIKDTLKKYTSHVNRLKSDSEEKDVEPELTKTLQNL